MHGVPLDVPLRYPHCHHCRARLRGGEVSGGVGDRIKAWWWVRITVWWWIARHPFKTAAIRRYFAEAKEAAR